MRISLPDPSWKPSSLEALLDHYSPEQVIEICFRYFDSERIKKAYRERRQEAFRMEKEEMRKKRSER